MGWSPSRGRVIGAQFSSSNDFKAEVHDSEGATMRWRIDPRISMTGLWPKQDAHGMMMVAQRQLDEWRAKDPAVPLGGRLVMTELTEHGIEMSIVGDLGLPARRDSEPKRMVTDAACIEAQQLVANAATEVDFATAAAGTVTSSSGTQTSDLTTKTWGNTLGYDVVVQIDHSVIGNVSFSGGGTGSARFEFYWDISSGGAAAADASPDLSTSEQSYSSVQQVTVPTGRTLTVKLVGKATRTGGSSVTNNYRLANTRITAIKR
jgi:hypothetical protein